MDPLTLESLAQKLDTLLERTAATGPRFLSVDGSATYSSLSPESVRRLVSSGKLTALRAVRGKILIDRHELDSLILSSTARPRCGRGRR